MASSAPTGIAPVLQVHPSRRCNLACAHCYTSSGPQAKEELHSELLLAGLRDAAALGYRQLAVSGGEPLLYGGLEQLLTAARQLGMVTTLTTNGMPATERRLRPLAPLLDLVAVSIDGTPAEHDAIRRRNGAFKRTVTNLGALRAAGVPFGLLFTLTQHNVSSLEFVVRLAAATGARSVQAHPLTLDGRARAELPDGRPDGIELGAALVEAQWLGERLGVAVHVDAVDARQLARFRSHLVPERPVTSLTAVAPVLILDADATVIPLTHGVDRGLALGSLADAPLTELAEAWLAAGHGDRLALACARAWEALQGVSRPAVYWYDEVAARTCISAPIGAS